jgi:hypothetical protein
MNKKVREWLRAGDGAVEFFLEKTAEEGVLTQAIGPTQGPVVPKPVEKLLRRRDDHLEKATSARDEAEHLRRMGLRGSMARVISRRHNPNRNLAITMRYKAGEELDFSSNRHVAPPYSGRRNSKPLRLNWGVGAGGKDMAQQWIRDTGTGRRGAEVAEDRFLDRYRWSSPVVTRMSAIRRGDEPSYSPRLDLTMAVARKELDLQKTIANAKALRDRRDWQGARDLGVADKASRLRNFKERASRTAHDHESRSAKATREYARREAERARKFNEAVATANSKTTSRPWRSRWGSSDNKDATGRTGQRYERWRRAAPWRKAHKRQHQARKAKK